MRAEEVAGQASVAASAFGAAFAVTVPPPVIEVNRAQLASLIADNALGQNTPAIMAVEAKYGEMWARNASAMCRYAGASAAATTLTPLAPPTMWDNPVDTAPDAADNAQDALVQLMSVVPQALRSLARPMQSASTASAVARLLRMSPFPAPVNAFAAAISSPMGMTSSRASAAEPAITPAWPDIAVSVAVRRGVLVGRLSVPRSWGGAAFGSLRSIA